MSYSALNTASRYSTVSTASSGYYQFRSEFGHLKSGRGRSYRSPFNVRTYQPPSSLARYVKEKDAKEAAARAEQERKAQADAAAEAGAETIRAAGGSPLMAALAKQGVPVVLIDDEGKITASSTEAGGSGGGFTPIGGGAPSEGAGAGDAEGGANEEAKRPAPAGFAGAFGDVVRIRQTRGAAATAESAAKAKALAAARAKTILTSEEAQMIIEADSGRGKYFGKRAKPAFFAASRAFDKLLPRLDAPAHRGHERARRATFARQRLQGAER